MASWERAKRMFMPDSTNDLVIPLSAPFYAALLTEHASGTWAGSGEPATEVVVGHDLVASLFDQRVGHIIGIVEQQLGEMRSATGEAGSEVVLLVGSFAESPYLSARLGERLAERNVRIAVPRSPALAVLAGAVHYGYDSPVLLTRRAPFSIGIGLALPFRPGRDPEDMRIISDENGELCRDRFATFVASRESVQTGRIVKRTFHPIRGDQTYITFRLLRTADADPQYTTDAGVEVVGTLSIDISDSMHLPINNRTVEVAMHLGQTYIHAEARNVGTGG